MKLQLSAILVGWFFFGSACHTPSPIGGLDHEIPSVMPAPLPAGFEVTDIAEDVFVVTTQPYSANSLVLRTVKRVIIVVDTPSTPADTTKLLSLIKQRWGNPPVFAINSHWHNDASGGNQVLVEHGVEVISSTRTANMLLERGDQLRLDLIAHFSESDPETAKELEAFRPTPATRTLQIDDSIDLKLGGETVRLVYPGPSHSADSIGVYFPERRLLYGGCAVRSNGRIVNRREADPDNWPRALQIFARLGPAVVVPGHGRRFDPAMIEESIIAARALSPVSRK